FLFAVLRVVNDEIGVFHECDVTLIARMMEHAVFRFPERLVVGHVRDRGAAAGDAIRDRRRSVVEVLGLDEHVADAEKALLELAGAGAAVEDDQRAVGRPHLRARGVAAVPRGALAGRGDRPTRTPESYVHAAPRLSRMGTRRL